MKLMSKKELSYLIESDDVNMNSTKEAQLDLYKKLVSTYNSKKSALESITSNDKEKWEEAAKKIIDGNKYLAMYWKIVKVKAYIREDELKLREGETLTNDEKKEIQNDITDNNKKIQEITTNIQKSIQEDLAKIKSA